MVAGCLPFRASSNQQLELLITSGAPPAVLPDACPVALQAIIYKALSASVTNRFPDAHAFEDDLRQFCEAPDKVMQTTTDNPTRKVSFRPPAPLIDPSKLQPAAEAGALRFNRTPASDTAPIGGLPSGIPAPISAVHGAIVRRPLRFSLIAGIGVLALYLIFSVGSAHSQVQGLYSSLVKADFPNMPNADLDAKSSELQNIRETATGRFFIFTSNLRSAIKPRLIEAAEHPINVYRTDQIHQPPLNDWLHAQSCLNLATEIDIWDKLARAELDIVEGHVAQLRKDYPEARQKFTAASSLESDSPDPWIGLAWLDAYVDNNLKALTADQLKEQQNHYTPAQREAAQRGDVSMILGRKAMNASINWRRKGSSEEETHFLREADDDFVRAENDYQGCRDWFRTEDAIEEIHYRRNTIQQRLAEITGSSK
jgi:hypothetical protein